MAVNDIDFLLQSSKTSDITRFKDGNALSERLEYWFSTPEGTLVHNPSWGHNLDKVQFDPTSKSLATYIKMSLARKLPLDIEDLHLKWVQVNSLSFDTCVVTIGHQFGATELSMQL